MKKNLILALFVAGASLLSCQSESNGSSAELNEDAQVELADSIASEIDLVIQDIQEETESTAKEIDSILESI